MLAHLDVWLRRRDQHPPTSPPSSHSCGASLLPLCAGVEPVRNRAWYVLQNAGSSGEMYACEVCFKEAIRDSGLGSCWRRKGAVREERVCEMYSARVRGQGRWRGWCARLRACATERMRVYAQTVPVMREIVVIARMRLRQRRVLNAASLFYLNLSVVSSPSMQVLYGPGAPQMQYGMGVLGWGLTGRRRGVHRVHSWGSKLRVR
jgi:hypothetical protein